MGPISPNPVPERIFDHVCLDVAIMPSVEWLGQEYDCMVICVDRLSGWIIAKPSLQEGLTAQKAAHLLLDGGWNEIGIPSLITSDQGSQFIGYWWKTLCSRLGVRLAYSQAYRPQGNGKAESAVKQIKTILRKLNAEQHVNWVEALPRALMIHHNSPVIDGLSPHQIVFGRDRNLAGIPISHRPAVGDALEFLDRMRSIDMAISESYNTLHQKQTDQYNAKRRGQRTFSVGEKIWLIKPRGLGGRGMATWWEGPYVITQRVGQNVYTINKGGGDQCDVHADQIKKSPRGSLRLRSAIILSLAGACVEGPFGSGLGA